MNKYEGIKKEISQDLKDGLLHNDSIIQLDLNDENPKWYYSDITMQRDFLTAKKDLDEGILDFNLFEKIEAIFEEYENNKENLKSYSVNEALDIIESKI